jgi:hypothetical protein|tara:strand:+ start:3824 stop:5257 length:1434 start_codon:yes stop_codon:yes gene_type:complete
MKVAFVFGKGIEGCGVTKGANVFEEWLVKQGHESLVIDFDNNHKFNRSKDTTWLGPILRLKLEDTANAVSEVVAEVNTCDIVIIHSMPTRKQGKYIDRFRNFVAAIKDPIIVTHDHGITKNNINMIPQAAEIMAMSDIGVVQSFEGYGRKGYTAIDPTMDDRIIENPIWVHTDEYDQYRKSFEDRRKHFLYIGRMSSIKDPALIPRIEPHLTADWDLSLIGCEKSIASVSHITNDIATNPAPYTETFKPRILIHSLLVNGKYSVPPKEMEKVGAPNNVRMNSYDRYIYSWGMENLGESMASWCGYRLRDPSEYGHRMEYTVIESFLLTVPVISRHFAENARSPEGKLWGEYYGPLVSEARCEAELAVELERIANNKEEWVMRTKACRALIYKFNDIDVIGKKFLDFVLSKGKRNNKIDFVKVISDYFPSASERRANGEVLITSAKTVIERLALTLVDGKQSAVKPPAIEPATLEGFF